MRWAELEKPLSGHSSLRGQMRWKFVVPGFPLRQSPPQLRCTPKGEATVEFTLVGAVTALHLAIPLRESPRIGLVFDSQILGMPAEVATELQTPVCQDPLYRY